MLTREPDYSARCSLGHPESASFVNDYSCADRILQMSTLGWGWGELWLSCKCQHICITQYPIFNSCKCQHYSLPVNPVGQTPSNPHHHKMRLLVSNPILSQEHVHCASDTLKSISHKKKTIPEFLILLCPLFSPPQPLLLSLTPLLLAAPAPQIIAGAPGIPVRAWMQSAYYGREWW